MAAGIWLGMDYILKWLEETRTRNLQGRDVFPSTAVVSGARPVPADCPGRAICVTRLNMRKWMKDRLRRRKKKAPEQGSQPAPPPLQPAYFDADQAPGSPDDSSHHDSSTTEGRRHESDRYQSDRLHRDQGESDTPATSER